MDKNSIQLFKIVLEDEEMLDLKISIKGFEHYLKDEIYDEDPLQMCKNIIEKL